MISAHRDRTLANRDERGTRASSTHVNIIERSKKNLFFDRPTVTVRASFLRFLVPMVLLVLYTILYTIYNIYNSICSNSSSSFKYQKAATISRAINIVYQRWFLVWNEMRKAGRAIEFDLSRPVKYLDFSLKLVITFYKTRSPYSPSILFRPSFLYSLELETLYLTVDWISSLYKRSIDWTNEQFEE